MRDHVDLRRVEPELVAQPPGAVLGVHDDRVHPLVERALAGELADGLRLAREHVVGGQHAAGARRGSRRASSACTDSHWKCTTSAARAARR